MLTAGSVVLHTIAEPLLRMLTTRFCGVLIKEDKEIKEENYHLRERRYGSFMRTMTLPMAVDSEKVEAVHENGVLTLRLPTSESVKPKKIAVKAIGSNGKA